MHQKSRQFLNVGVTFFKYYFLLSCKSEWGTACLVEYSSINFNLENTITIFYSPEKSPENIEQLPEDGHGRGYLHLLSRVSRFRTKNSEYI